MSATVTSDLVTEYVAAGPRAWVTQTQQAVQALPHAFDPLLADFGDDLYERMLRDAQVHANLRVLTTATLEDGLILEPAVTDQAADGYALATTIADVATRMLDDLVLPLDDVLRDMLTARMLGHRIAEVTYYALAESPIPGIQPIRTIKVKPRHTLAVAVDRYLNVVGLVAAPAGGGLVTGTRVDPGDLLPREKFWVYTHDPHNSDPRGTSLGRAAYNAWWSKQQLIGEWLKYLAQFATPSLLGVTSEQARAGRDASGQELTAEQVLLDQLLAFANGTALAVPAGTTVSAIQVAGDGAAFLRALDYYNREITVAMLTQTSATMEAVFDSRAKGETGKNILDTIVRQGKRSLARSFRRDVLRPFVRHNYGDAALALTPQVSLGSLVQEDVTSVMNAIANLGRAGLLYRSQLPGIYTHLRLPQPAAGDADRLGSSAAAPTDPANA